MSPRISIRLLAAQSDQRLVALVKEGHERAFEALVQRYRRPLLRYCRRFAIGLGRRSASDHGGSEQASPQAGRSGGDHQLLSGAEAGGKTDG